MTLQRRTRPTKEGSVWSGDGSKHYDAGAIDAYVCAACGFTELWSRDLDNLAHHPEDGVHFIDATHRQGE